MFGSSIVRSHISPSRQTLLTRQRNINFMTGHIEWHLEVGLAIQLIEAPLIAQERNTVPQVLYDQCRDLKLPISGNAAGHASLTDLSGLPLGPYQQVLGWRPKGIVAMTGCVIPPFQPHFSSSYADGVLTSRCVLTAVLGMLTVLWYSLGGHITEEEFEHEVREKLAAKEKRGRFFGLFGKKA